MTEDAAYLALLEESGKRKLKATMRLPYGDDDSRFEAAVLFHEAAAIEEQAWALAPSGSPETHLGAVIEKCACLILGLDVFGAVSAFREVERLSANLPPEFVSAQRDRLNPMFQTFWRDVEAHNSRSPILLAADFHWEKIPEQHRTAARAELAAWLERFPGEAVFHLLDSRAALHERRLDEARHAALRAHRLQPTNPLYRWLLLLFVADAMGSPDAFMSRTEAERHLRRTYEDLGRKPADALVYLGFMMASFAAFLVAFFNGEDASTYRDWVRWAATIGGTRPSVAINVPKQVEDLGKVMGLLTDNPGIFDSLVDVLLPALTDTDIAVSQAIRERNRTPAHVIRNITYNLARSSPLLPTIDLAA